MASRPLCGCWCYVGTVGDAAVRRSYGGEFLPEHATTAPFGGACPGGLRRDGGPEPLRGNFLLGAIARYILMLARVPQGEDSRTLVGYCDRVLEVRR